MDYFVGIDPALETFAISLFHRIRPVNYIL